MANNLERSQLIEIIHRIQDGIDSGEPVEALAHEFNSRIPNSDVENLCRSDYSAETIVDICIGRSDVERQLTEGELRKLIEEIRTHPAETEAKAVLRVLLFAYNCHHPAGSDLLFFPEESLGKSNPSTEEILRAALSRH